MSETRKISDIAAEIRADWGTRGRGVSPYAAPYLDAMGALSTVEDSFYLESAADVIRRFLLNATTWRGETARRVKAELNAMVKGRY